MNQNTVSRIAIIVYALVLLFFGAGHLMNASKMAGMVPAYFPGGIFWVYLSGAGMVLAAIALITGKQVRLASYLVGAMLLVFILTIHLPGVMNVADENARMMPMMMMMKDLGLAAGAFVIGSKSS